jgi:hypothetical protein
MQDSEQIILQYAILTAIDFCACGIFEVYCVIML